MTKTKTDGTTNDGNGNRTPDAVDLWQTLLASDKLTPDAQAYTAAVGARTWRTGRPIEPTRWSGR